MPSLAKRIKRAPNIDAVNDCLAELGALIALAGKRIDELKAEEWDPRLDDAIETGPQ
jgi:hypothetical protein